jgi:lysozyme
VSGVDKVINRLMVEEGFRANAYRDTAGKLTIGYGFNVDAGISQRAARALLVEQTIELDQELMKYPWYAALDDTRKSVILDMAFNGGIGGLLNYPHMIAALTAGDWKEAAAQCVVDNPKLDASRYAPLRQLLLTGDT